MPIVYCDGGCLGNGTAQTKTYGSFLIEGVDDENSIHSLDLACRTNNEAEYETLRAALQYCINHQIRNPEVRMDSALVVNQVNMLWKVKQPHLQGLRADCRAYLSQAHATLVWVPRDEIVSKLGH